MKKTEDGKETAKMEIIEIVKNKLLTAEKCDSITHEKKQSGER